VMIRFALLLTVVAAAVLDEQVARQEFASFLTKYSKAYEREELERRCQIFRAELEAVRRHNAGNFSWKAAINFASDLTPAEFYGNARPIEYEPKVSKHRVPHSIGISPVDWRVNATARVKSVFGPGPAECSTWPFGLVAAVEAYNVLFNKNRLVALSEQQVVDCASPTFTCRSGGPIRALEYIVEESACAETDYPWLSVQEHRCTAAGLPRVARVDDAASFWDEDESILLTLLMRQPIAAHPYIGLGANEDFKRYSSGVYDTPCIDRPVPYFFDFSMAIVGYNTTRDGQDYFILKNAWGTDWGQHGYVYWAAHKNLCHIQQYLVVPWHSTF